MKGEFITLETAKRIEQIKQNRKKYENQHEKMNMSIVDANIKLQDENKLLKNDNEILKKRIDKAIEYINEYAWQEDIIGDMWTTTGEPVKDRYMRLEWDNCNELLEILKGESIWEK